MEFGSVDDVINFAIDKEKEAVTFYSSLAKEATNTALKETFENFAKEEAKHVTLLADMAGNKEKIDSYEFKEVTDLKISDYMVEIEYQDGMLMPDILKLAMKREEKAVLLYTALGNHTDNEDAKKVFQILVQEEAQHKLALESMYDDYLADQDS
ncbi:MAG: ferritin family protein [Desulfobacteraceae bacterium]|nr:ferritin family protein [Desulfobacteraceae bacterium]